MYICDCCNFKTTRLFNYQRHLSRATHERQVFLTLDNNDSFTPGTIEVEPPLDLFVSTVIEEDLLIHAPSLSRSKESDNDYQENHETADDNENCNSDGPSDKAPTWYPFSSKAEMLLYIFMNSTTHPVSHVVVKFVMFMMKELKVEGIPSIQKLSSMNIGDLSWEDLVTKDTDKENVPFWVIKPSEVVRLSVAHPDVAKSLIRYPQQSNQNVHPSTSSKWRDDILFKTASYGQKRLCKRKYLFHSRRPISLVETMQKRYIPVSLLKPADIQSIKHAYRISRGSLTELKDEDFTAFVHLETSLPVLSVPINLFLGF
ncbi:unnamed protein product [Mytilus coruscus]|uniref:Uncharacterized protein n=1 Tax=Mytilus coruscus TaxID=42192 RepID=A0A6J8C288_MYTCO|nr:unnamed protein product [Mytilus coruscus]